MGKAIVTLWRRLPKVRNMDLTCSALNFTQYPWGCVKYLIEHKILTFINKVVIFSVTFSVVKTKDYLIIIIKIVQNQESKCW